MHGIVPVFNLYLLFRRFLKQPQVDRNKILRASKLKIGFTGLVLGSIFFILFFYLTNEYLHETEAQRMEQIRQLVTIARNTVEPVIRRHREGAISRDDALSEVRNLVRRMTYTDFGQNNYIFMSSYDGTMLVQPFERKKELSNQWDLKDVNGLYIIRELVKTAREYDKGGYTIYHYLPPGSWFPEEKRAFVIGVPELEAYIGTGRYMGDIKKAHSRFTTKVAGMSVILFLFLTLMVYYAIRAIRLQNIALHKEIDFRKETENKLRDSSERYRIVSEQEGQIIYDLNVGTGDIEWLGDIKGVTGFSTEEMAALDRENWVERIHPDDYRKTIKQINSSIDSRSQHHATYRFKTKDDSWRYIDDHGVSILNAAGEERMLGIMRDITETRKKDSQLVQAQKMETIGILAGGLAHDFNNVLGGIKGGVSLINLLLSRENLNNSEKITKFINTVENNVDRAADMVKQLLTISRRYDLEMAPVDLNQSIANVVKICRNSFPKSVEIETRLPDSSSMVYGDPTGIEQVLLNICVNASHAMTIMREEGERDGGKLYISLEKVEPKSAYHKNHPEISSGQRFHRITIHDTGVGMDDETRRHIFDPFFTKKSKDEGTGLGLSMVYSIVKKHGGLIDVVSESGNGTTFSLHFPAFKRENRRKGKLRQPQFIWVREKSLLSTTRRLCGLSQRRSFSNAATPS